MIALISTLIGFPSPRGSVAANDCLDLQSGIPSAWTRSKPVSLVLFDRMTTTESDLRIGLAELMALLSTFPSCFRAKAIAVSKQDSQPHTTVSCLRCGLKILMVHLFLPSFIVDLSRRHCCVCVLPLLVHDPHVPRERGHWCDYDCTGQMNDVPRGEQEV
jgi:hypothetical protein